MSLTYSSFVDSLVNLMPTTASDAGFVAMLPNCIDDAEQRLYRELDLQATLLNDSSSTMVAGANFTPLPTTNGTVVTLVEVNMWSPVGTFTTSHSLTPASVQMINLLFGNGNYTGIPQYFAFIGGNIALVGPAPDQAYNMETWATYRPSPLSASNTTTLLSVFFPDLLIAASMVFASAYMKNFGAQVDDPKMGVSWETHLQELLKSAHVEESRKKFTSQGWSSEEPAPLATPPRT